MILAGLWARAWFAASLVACAGAVVWAPWWVALISGMSLIASVATGSFVMGAGLFARPVLGVAPEHARGRVALTFDDGPDAAHTRRVMDVLEREGHRATFFVIGRKAHAERELVSEIARRGHGVANHSYAHAHNTPALPVEKLVEDFARAGALIEELTGRRTKLFRAPMGILSPRVAGAVERLGLSLIGWTATARDGTRRATVESSLARLLPSLRAGAILVLHDAAERDDRAPIAVNVLERLVGELKTRGLVSVPLDELMTDAVADRGSNSQST